MKIRNFWFFSALLLVSSSIVAQEDSVSISSSRYADRVEKSILRLIIGTTDLVGLNGPIQAGMSEDLLELANRSLAADTASSGGRFSLYPYKFFGAISINPNENYLLLKGSVVDFSQTQTLLPNYTVRTSLDSTGSYYLFADQYGRTQSPLLQPTLVSKDDYVKASFDFQARNLFNKSVASSVGTAESQAGGALELFRTSVTTNETFQKIFGGDEVVVDATGNINLSVSGEQQKTSNQNSTTGRNSTFTPKFEQRQRFNLRGTIGKKVEILFDQDSEREFDFENNIKVTYTGFDDEILQKLEAGNIDLSLPGTEFVTTGGQNKGLFGVKALFKFANLNVTTIASIQRGEKTRLTFKGGGTSTPINLKAQEYAKAKFFFLQEAYRDNYQNYSPNGIHIVSDANRIIGLQVYKFNPTSSSVPGSIPGIAINNITLLTDPNLRNYTKEQIQNMDNDGAVEGVFELVPADQYTYNDQLGILELRNSISPGTLLAAWFKTNSQTVGYIDDPTYLRLKLVWSNNPLPTDPSWTLEMKNVYDFRVTSLSEDDARTLKITYSPNFNRTTATTTITDRNGQTTSLLKILHVDEKAQATSSTGSDDIVDNDEYGYGLNYLNGYLTFPRLRPFDPEPGNLPGFSQEVYPLDTLHFPNIYDLARIPSNDAEFQKSDVFNIEMTTSKKSSSYNLGINILEGSEEVVLNGTQLTKDVDYVIDYFSGTIELLSPEASLPDANLEIRYEQAQLFQIEKKSIFGARAEYSLIDLGFGGNSFIGTTALFQSQSTINKRVQLGEEPFTNFVWDVNTNLDFEAKYLTKLVNYLPLVNSVAPSKINFRAEYAKIIPNPNTSNGLMKNDEGGVAYVDDFEAVKRTFPLGTTRKAWTFASTPVDRNPMDRGYLVWFQKQEPRSNISFLQTTAGDNVITLGLALQPTASNPKDSWGGIIKGFSTSAANELSNSRFIELWVKNYQGTAKIHIDIGQISEDQNGNSKADREVKSGLTIGFDERLDRGLDDYDDQQEADTLLSRGITPGNQNLSPLQQAYIDSLQLAFPWGLINVSADDPFGDNWDRDQAQITNVKVITDAIENNNLSFLKPNGLQGNAADGITKIPDTEDLNGNAVIDNRNNYLSYSFSTDTTSADKSLIIGRGKEDWVLYRIPIFKTDTTVGDAKLENISNARIWITPESNSNDVIALQIAEFQFVTSEWTFANETPGGVVLDPNGKQPDPDDVRQVVEISSISTEEGGEYTKPPGVKREFLTNQSSDGRRRETKEQSLNLKLNSLPPLATAQIVKSFRVPLDFRNYDRLRMFVHGDRSNSGSIVLPIDNDTPGPISYFLRFGDGSFNYYELELPLYQDWNERNFLDIDLQELSARKIDQDVPADEFGIRTFPIGNGKFVRIKGNPSLASVKLLTLGVNNYETLRPYSGDVWFDELRLTNANDKPGQAVKAALSFNLSDFGSVSTYLQHQTAEFRRIDERPNPNGANTTSWSVTGNIGLQKFQLENWGITLPLSFSVTSSKSSPKFLPGNDILVSQASDQNRTNLISLRTQEVSVNDSLLQVRLIGTDTAYIRQLALDSAGIDSLVHFAENFGDSYRSSSLARSFSISFGKARNEKNFWLVRLTIDPLSSSFSYSLTEQKNPQILSKETTVWTSRTAYSLPFKKRTWKPFRWTPLTGAPIIGSLLKNFGDTEINYAVISNVSTDFSLSSTEDKTVERGTFGTPIYKPQLSTLTSSRGYGISISPWNTITSTLNAKYDSDLRGLSASEILTGVAKGLNPFDGFNDFTFDKSIDTIRGGQTPDSLIFNRDFSATNSFNITYTPLSFSFLSHSIAYTSNAASRRQRPPVTQFNESSTINRTVQIDAGFSLRSFVSVVKEPFGTTSKKSPPKPDVKKSRRDRFKSLGSETSGSEESSSSEDTSKVGTAFRNVTKKVGSFADRALSTINDVRFSIRFDNGYAFSGLDRRVDPSLKWFGYATTSQSGFLKSVFSFDLDTLNQFSRPDPTESFNLYRYDVTKSIGYNFLYGFNLTLFTVDLKFDHRETRALSGERLTRTVDRSTLFPWLSFVPVPLFYDVTLRATNVGRWPLFNLLRSATSNMNLSFSFTSKETERWESSTGLNYLSFDTLNRRGIGLASVEKSQTIPQINFDISWKGNISQNIIFINTNTETNTYSNLIESNQKSITSDINYVKRGGFRIPLPFLRKKQIDNQIQISARLSFLKRKAFSTQKKVDEPNETIKTDELTQWSIAPRFDYSFSKWVTGGGFFQYEWQNALRTGKITRFLAGININITIGA